VFYGGGVPRGNGSPVLVTPGFLGDDGYLAVLRGWLRRIGYRPYSAGLGVALGSPWDLIARTIDRADAIAQTEGRPVTVLGHSLGGAIGRVLAARRPDLVTHLVTLGVPADSEAALRATHPLVKAMGEVLMRDRVTGAGGIPATRALLYAQAVPATVRLTSIYSRDDGVVDRRAFAACESHAVVHAVGGSHAGLAWNAEVYRLVGRALAAG
jgi:pimeloyl-ACP methyl ester carboxylesterase